MNAASGTPVAAFLHPDMTAERSTNDPGGTGAEKSGGKPLYLIALVPGPSLREEVRLLKEEMRLRFGASHALKSPAHITLQMPFRRAVTEEAGLLKTLGTFSDHEEPIEIRLSGFDCFPPRVLFIRVADHEPLTGLQSRLAETLVHQLGFPQKKEGFPFHPHMTIATRDLTEPNFHKAWEGFKEREFSATFTADRLFLLRHNGRTWDLYREFPFQRIPAP